MEAATFHPAVAAWFGRTHGQPMPAQAQGWPAIQSGRHTLIAAPTGSGKTLAAFLCALDGLVRQGLAGTLEPTTQVLYVSPLKALSNDIQRNLEAPLRGIQAELAAHGLPPVALRALVRTGDTPAAERVAMIKRPPHILVTTPESLFILLTSANGRRMLAGVRTVIVDEIHALVETKRGAHLTLSLERLEALAGPGLQRVGLSATQHPIEEVARYLVGGWAPGAAPRECSIINMGHRRRMDLAIELPASPLEAVMGLEVWQEVYQRLVSLIQQHRTTLVFVNTRRMAERVARALSEKLGPDQVTSHHGSLAKEQRLKAEQRLKSGELKALVATASLELGIDIGAVDLVCQLGSTRSISTLLQRVGRSGHQRGGLPKGRLFPLTRDELVECAALQDALGRGELDRLHVPEQPLDLLAQQLVAMAACEEWDLEALLDRVRRAYPYRNLQQAEFDAVVDMLAQGFIGPRGRQGAFLHKDAIQGKVRARRGARLAAITNGGAIPDNADYEVVQSPTDIFVGTVNEDFAIESLPGDIFQLGNTSWRILRVEPGKVRVEDAQGQPPTMPFWLGEAPGRTGAVSAAVSRLRAGVEQVLLGQPPPVQRPLPGPPADEALLAAPKASSAGQAYPVQLAAPPIQLALDLTPPEGMTPATPSLGKVDAPEAPRDESVVLLPRPVPVPPALAASVEWLMAQTGVDQAAALQIADYLARARAALGVMPTQETLVLERFFDESGGMQLVLHAPFGSRLNRAWGLALRKRFCRKFNFELQAAATEDAIVLSLGPTHSFPLEEVFRYLHSQTVRPVLVQALLDAPMFGIRWRHNANRALAVLRRSGSRKVPPRLQRMRADDLLTLAFPDQAACAENLAGDREIPDHPLVRQTIADCLHEAMDITGLEGLLAAVEGGAKRLEARDLPEPSPLAMEILNARPYAFLDGAPLEERRTQAVVQRRWLDADAASSLGALDPQAIAQVGQEAWPSVSGADELHDALQVLGVLTEAEGLVGARAPLGGMAAGDSLLQTPEAASGSGWEPWLGQLIAAGRATRLRVPSAAGTLVTFWAAAEALPLLRVLYPQAQEQPPVILPPALAGTAISPEDAAVALLRGRLLGLGPTTAQALARSLALAPTLVEQGLLTLESQGVVLRGRFTPGLGEPEWCERGLLARIHRYTLNRLRQEIEPVTPAHLMRFLLGWQHLSPEERVEGVEGLAGLLEQMEGFEAPASAWEADLLPARTEHYDPEWLERLCLQGRSAWARLSPPAPGAPGARRWGPVATTPIAFLQRSQLELWRPLLPGSSRTLEEELGTLSAPARALGQVLATRGACFFSDLVQAGGLLPTQAEAALGELVNAGLATCDGMSGLRALLQPAAKRPPVQRLAQAGGGLANAGRWSLLHTPRPVPLARLSEADMAALETMAGALLRRYGVICRRLLERERLAPPWRDLLRVYRAWEAQGKVRGGRFVTGLTGEQFALPEAVTRLREVRRVPPTGQLAVLSAADPLNLVGTVLPGDRIPALSGNRVLLRDGEAVACREGGRFLPLVPLDESTQWAYRRTLEGAPGVLPGSGPRLAKLPG